MTAAADLAVAFQPVVAANATQPFAWAAVASPRCGKSFAMVAGALHGDARVRIEAQRITLAIEDACARGLRVGNAMLAIPLGAGTGADDALLAHLLRTALSHGFPIDRLVVEIDADERGDLDAAVALARACANRGVSIGLDGFAAGPAALKLLAGVTPLYVRLAGALVHNIEASTSRRLMAEGVMRLARSLGVKVIACGADSRGGHAVLAAIGVHYFQIETAALLPPDLLRREPRTAATPHRRLAHHQRAAIAPACARSAISTAMAG